MNVKKKKKKEGNIEYLTENKPQGEKEIPTINI